MTKQEFEKLAKWAIVEEKKTGKRFEVKEKTYDLVFSDGRTGKYKDYKVCSEHTESFNSLYSYDYLRNQWIFDCKMYSENRKWYWIWNHEYVRDIDDHKINEIEKICEMNKEKNIII